MFNRIALFAVAALIALVASETHCSAQGFGGYHRAAVRGRNVSVARNVNVGVRGAAYRPYGYRGGGGYGYGRALPYGSYGDDYGNVYLPPNPGQGPVGIDSLGSDNKDARSLRLGNQSNLNAALNQMKLPGDAGLPPAPPVPAKAADVEKKE